MTGTVLHSDNPNYPKRSQVIFAAEDNSAAPTLHFDVITPLFLLFDNFDGNCHEVGEPLTMFQLNPDSITIEF